MARLRLYVETSVWSHWFADDTPERRDATRDFLKWCAAHREDATLYVSALVIEEMGRAPGALADRLSRLVHEYAPRVLETGDDARKLAASYVRRKVIPAAKAADALHAAMATVHNMDVLVSWNYRHLVNVLREARINAVNIDGGYQPIRIATPLEVTGDEVQQGPG